MEYKVTVVNNELVVSAAAVGPQGPTGVFGGTNVTVSGGIIDGTVIGGLVPSDGTFASLAVTKNGGTGFTSLVSTNTNANGKSQLQLAASTGGLQYNVSLQNNPGVSTKLLNDSGDKILISPGNVDKLEVNSTGASVTGMLKVTQTGSGNAFVVEDAASDTTPFVIDANGKTIIGHTAGIPGYGAINPPFQLHGIGGQATCSFSMSSWMNNSSSACRYVFQKSNSGTIGTYGVNTLASGGTLGGIDFTGDDGTVFRSAASIDAFVDGTPSAGDMPGRLVFSTTADGASTPTERMRINSSGRVLIARTTASTGADGLIQASVQGATLPAIQTNTGSTSYRPHWILAVNDVESAAIGTTNGTLNFYTADANSFQINNLGGTSIYPRTGAGAGLNIAATNLSGSTTNYGVFANIVWGSAATVRAQGFQTSLGTEATTFTLGEMSHFKALRGVIGAGSTITNQYGFFADDTIIGATNNYGFYSNIPSAAGRFNFYAAGTADNYFAGDVNIGMIHASAGTPILKLRRGRDDLASGVGIAEVVFAAGTADTTVAKITALTAGTSENAADITFSTASTGILYERMRINSAGNIGKGGGDIVQAEFDMRGNKVVNNGTIYTGFYNSSAVTDPTATTGIGFNTYMNPGTGSALTTLTHFNAGQRPFVGTATYQVGFNVGADLIGATNNWGFRGGITATAGRYNLYMDGSADNWLSGNTFIGNVNVGTNLLNVINSAGDTSVQFDGSGNTSLVLGEAAANASCADIQFRKARGNYNTKTAVLSGDTLGSIVFVGHDSVNSYQGLGAQIVAMVDGTPGAASMPGKLSFRTSASGSIAPTERLMIDSVGQTTITANNTTTALKVTQAGIGNAFVVEDVASDTTPFVIDADGGVFTGNALTVRPPHAAGEGGQINITAPDGTTATIHIDVVSANSARMFTLQNNVVMSIGQMGGTGGSVSLYTGATERMRIDSSGRFLINSGGVADATGVVNPYIQAHGLNGTAVSFGQYSWNVSSGAAPYHTFNKSRGASVATRGAVGSADDLGVIHFNGDDGTNFVRAVQIYAGVDGAVSTGIVPGKLGFYTNSTAGSLTERMRIDSSGNVMAVSATGVLGYGTGAGGTVTQTTSKSTAVQLDKPTGFITMHAESIVAGASKVFTLTNSLIVSNNLLLLNCQAAGAKYQVVCLSCGTGAASIRITNITAGDLAEAVVINFAVLKGAQL